MGAPGRSQYEGNEIRMRHRRLRRLHRAFERQRGSRVPNASSAIEGLSVDGSHPLQKAWIELDVPQCGYCQAGQLMQAAALLARNSKPSNSDIDSAMTGNVCRCGTYIRIREAIHLAANGGRRG
jgi:hypothetical protein